MRPIDWSKPEPTSSGTTVVREQARIIAANPAATAAVSVLAAVMAGGALLTSIVPAWLVGAWFAAVVLVALYDLRVVSRYSEDMDAETCGEWLVHNMGSSVAVGVTWGSLGWFLFFEPGAAYATLIVMTLIGVAGAAATLSGIDARLAMATFVPALLPLAVHYAFHGTIVGAAMAVSVTAYAVLLYAAVRSRERSLHQLVALHAQSRDLADQLRIVADYSYAWEAWLSEDGKLLWVNPSVEQVTGYTPEECRRMPDYPMPIVHPDDRDAVSAVIGGTQRVKSKGHSQSRIVCKDGTVRWIVAEWQPARDGDGNPAGVRVSVRDITETVELQQELTRQASTDPLTGVMNRRRFLEVCEGEMYRAARFGRPIALAMFDLDFFKRINDAHGHAVGDQCLRAFVGAVRANIRQTDTLARFGGEEFTLLMPETGLEAARALCERLREAVARATVATAAETLGLTVSVGVTVCDLGETSIDPALARADAALYAAKNKGRNRVEVATPPTSLAGAGPDARAADDAEPAKHGPAGAGGKRAATKADGRQRRARAGAA